MAQMSGGERWGARSAARNVPCRGFLHRNPATTRFNPFPSNSASTTPAPSVPTEVPVPPPPALAALVEGMELRNKSVPGVRGNGRGMAYGKLYFRGQKSVTMWRRIASDNE